MADRVWVVTVADEVDGTFEDPDVYVFGNYLAAKATRDYLIDKHDRVTLVAAAVLSGNTFLAEGK